MEIHYSLPNVTSTLQIIGCHIGETEPHWSYPWHHHYLFELLYCKRGRIKQTVGEDSFYLHSGDWLLIKSGISHATENVGDCEYQFFNLHFDLDDSLIREELCRGNYIVVNREEADRLQLNIHYMKLEQAIQTRSNHNTAKLDQAINQLTIQSVTLEIIKEMITFNRAAKRSGVISGAVNGIDDIDDSHFMNSNSSMLETELAHAIEEKLKNNPNIKINELAKELGITRGRCTTIFTKVFGQSPRQYVSSLVLNQAKHLLVHSTLTIEEIAEELQFQSASHFSRQFRRWTGMAPSHFRPKYIRSK